MRFVYITVVMILTYIITVGSILTAESETDQNGADAEMMREYEDLQKELLIPSASSDRDDAVRRLPSVEKLSKHGVKVLPFLMDKFRGETISINARHAIKEIASRVTKRLFYKMEDFKSWWETGGKDTQVKFAALYDEWKKAVKKRTDAGQPLVLYTSTETLLSSHAE